MDNLTDFIQKNRNTVLVFVFLFLETLFDLQMNLEDILKFNVGICSYTQEK